MAPLLRDRTESLNWPLLVVDAELGVTEATQASSKEQVRESVVEVFNVLVQSGGIDLALLFGIFAVLSYQASDNALTATKMSNQIALLQWCTSNNNNMTRPICDDIYAKANLTLIVLKSYGPPSSPPDDENKPGWWIIIVVVAAIALLGMLLPLAVDYNRWAGLVWRTWRDRRRWGLTTRWRGLPEAPKPERIQDPIEQKMLNALTKDELLEYRMRQSGFI